MEPTSGDQFNSLHILAFYSGGHLTKRVDKPRRYISITRCQQFKDLN